MKLIDQCCSKEQAIKLKKLGIDQISLFTWHCQKTFGHGGVAENDQYWDINLGKPPLITDLVYSAFTVAELGMMIGPDKIMPQESIEPGNHWYQYDIPNQSTEALARAELLILLLERDILKVKDVNAKL